IELRRVNDSMTDTMGKQWSSRSLMKCYDQAASAFGWSKRNAKPGSMRDGDWLIGWGCASAIYPTHVGAAAARVRLLATGEARVQMAAERLGIPLSKVQVQTGDSALPPSPVAGGSNQTASCCNVVMKACDAIREKLTHAAITSNESPLAGKSAGQIRFTEGRAVSQEGGEERLADLFKRMGVGAIEEYAEFLPPGAKPDAIKNLYAGMPFLGGGSKGEKLMYALGAEFVEVRINELTREIRVP